MKTTVTLFVAAITALLLAPSAAPVDLTLNFAETWYVAGTGVFLMFFAAAVVLQPSEDELAVVTS